ncbi:MAG: M48 family metallopeptidase [Dehalococcoidales bacterium]|nr:M48 family metallopeptidase [Dehalococcoidales bacterium]
MTDSREIYVDGVGLILFERSIRAKRVIIYVRLFKKIRVAIPSYVSFKSALKFVHLKKPWIQKHLARIKRMESQSPAVNSLVSINKADASKKLTSRLHYFAEKYGFTCNKVTIRNQKTRWGSCSYKNNISLNMKLILLPDEVVDYVILHELVHTRIHDHSKRFWVELDKYVGDGKLMVSKI